MQPAPLDLTLYRGDDFGLSLVVYSGSFNVVSGQWEKGPPLNLTGWTGAAQIRATEDTTGPPLAEFTVAINPDQVGHRGAVFVSLSDSITAALAPGVWDLQFIDSGGNKLTYL